MAKTVIDEKELMARIAGKTIPVQAQEEKVQEEMVFVTEENTTEDEKEKKRKKKSNSYDERFLKRNIRGMRMRSITLSFETIDRIEFIVRKSLHGNMPVGTFIDNILCDHIDTYADEFNLRYQKQDFNNYIKKSNQND